MHLTEGIIIVLIAQIPFGIYEVIKNIRRDKIERNKLKAEEQSALGNAVEGAGKTLVEAWERIESLEAWKTKASEKIDQLEHELRMWRNYAARLIKRLREVDPCGPVPDFETEPKISGKNVTSVPGKVDA